MIINSVLLIFDCHLYYCLGGISSLGLLAGIQRRIEEKKEKKEEM
jgi:hypothetical protein